ncbi:MAG TPA: YihY/virulence factor BrkB family protein [Gaiellaceae bacterium]|nr:YihY/virulence factor BrkB family protein [Gaiellaceae bacterium]
MKLLQRNRKDDYHEERPLPDEAPDPQPEREEPRLDDPGPHHLSRRDYFAVVRRAVKKFNSDNMTSIAAALAYYAFLAIPAALLVAVGVFSLLAGPDAITTVIDKVSVVMPGQATSLLEDSLKNLTQHHGTGVALLSVGAVLAIWSVTGAMQNVMWAVNIAYGRDESRGFVRRRLVALAMALFGLIAFALVFGLLILGPQLSHWVGSAVGAESVVHAVWWIAQWPLLIAALLIAFAAVMYLAPNVKHPRWTFLTIGAVVAIVIWLVASAAFAFYVSKFGSYNKAWGSLAAVVIMLTWLWLSAVALLLGAEVNAEAERSRELRSGEPAERELQAPAKA